MPWDTIVNALYAGDGAQGQANAAAQQQTQLGANQIAEAQQGLMNHQMQNQYGGNPWGQGHIGGGFADYAAQAQMPQPRNDDFLQLLNEFSYAFQHGIREVVVEVHIFQRLYEHLATRARLFHNPAPGVTHLVVATAGGYIKIVCEGKQNPTIDDFDRYMEDVNEHAP
jgi:hypothetical protein